MGRATVLCVARPYWVAEETARLASPVTEPKAVPTMADLSDYSSALHVYAQQVLAGTGLTEADVYATTGADDEGSAAQALRHGWELARRAAKVAAE